MREEDSSLIYAGTPSVPATIPAEEWGPGYRFWRSALQMLSQRGPEGTTSLVRIVSHLLIIFVAVFVLSISRLHLPSWEITEVERPIGDVQVAPIPANGAHAGIAAAGALVRAAAPVTLIHERPRTETIAYKVQPNDTLYAIAEKFNITAETLMWANNMEDNPDLLRLDQELIILPVSGVLHTVVQGDTVDSIAKKYKANPDDILGFEGNGINPKNPALTPGARVIVPGGSKPQVARPAVVYSAPSASSGDATHAIGRFVWPASGMITQRYAPLHRAIDIAAGYGSAVKASDAGYVVVAGWSNVGYGNYVVLDHGNGYQTLYAHLSKIYVVVGNSVAQGAAIGAVGSTGNSTGPHLHFEIHQGGAQMNPFNFLP